MAECPTCHGLGEVPVAGTYGPTISPEHLETRPCPRCHGEEVVTVPITCAWHGWA